MGRWFTGCAYLFHPQDICWGEQQQDALQDLQGEPHKEIGCIMGWRLVV